MVKFFKAAFKRSSEVFLPSKYKISVTPPGVTFCIDKAILSDHITAPTFNPESVTNAEIFSLSASSVQSSTFSKIFIAGARMSAD